MYCIHKALSLPLSPSLPLSLHLIPDLILLNLPHIIPPSLFHTFPTWAFDSHTVRRGGWNRRQLESNCLPTPQGKLSFKEKNDCPNFPVIWFPVFFFSFVFYSAVQLDSCGSQDSGHSEHQDWSLCRHEQRGLPLHFGTVSTHCNPSQPTLLHHYLLHFMSSFTLYTIQEVCNITVHLRDVAQDLAR